MADMCSTLDTETQLDLDQLKRELDVEWKSAQQLDSTATNLLIDRLTIRWTKSIDLVAFKLEQIHRFGIDYRQNYVTNQSAHRLIDSTDWELNVNLGEGFFEALKSNKLIEKYSEYRDLKWTYFLKSLKQNGLIGGEEQCFVSFGGVMADMLATAEDDRRPWKVFAQMFNKNIYLRNNRSYFDDANKLAYCGLKFLYLLTDRDRNDINEFEKCFAINRARLGQHNIVTLNEIDAIDHNNMTVELKVKRETDRYGAINRNRQSISKKCLLKAWAQCSVSGTDRIIFGKLDSNHCLESINEYKMDDIPEDCALVWSDIKCLDFLNRLLNFIKKCVTEQMVVYEFSFNRREEFISCNRINDEDSMLLPKWYTELDCDHI